MIELILLFICLAAASASDIRTREVPDWLSYAMIISGVGINLIRSLVLNDPSYIAFSLLGLGVFVALGCGMYYLGQWGGGDSKVLMGVGALLGLEASMQAPFISINSMLISFWLNMLVAGLAFGLVFSMVMALRNFKKFIKEFIAVLHNYKRIQTIIFAFSGCLLILSAVSLDLFLQAMMLGIVIISLLSLYIWLFSKAVEQSCMLRLAKPSELTEGDWIVKDVTYKGRYLCGPKDLGVSKKQIAEMVKLETAGKLRQILVKDGIPFIPSFLIALILTLAYGNIMFGLIT